MKQYTFQKFTLFTLAATLLICVFSGELRAENRASKKTEHAKILFSPPTTESRFIRLSTHLLENHLRCPVDPFAQAFPQDKQTSACFAPDERLLWAFANPTEMPLGFGLFSLKNNIEPPDEQQLVIQPLHVHLGKYTPLFKQFYTPMGKTRYMSVDELPKKEQAWLKKQQKLNKDKSENSIERLLATDAERESPPICYRYSMDASSSVIAGVGWIYDIADTTGMAETFAEMGYDTTERMGAVNLTLGYSFNSFTLTGGYIHAIESRDELENASQDGQEKDPTAWRSQLAYNTRLLNRPAMFAVGYQKSSETLCHYLPEERYTTKASIMLRDHTTLSLEYYKDREYAGGDGVDGGEAYGITTKLGFQF